ARDFADYSALTNPQPITVEDARIQIKDNEALIVFLDTAELGPTPEETFIWVVTKTDTHWVRSDIGTTALAKEVAALRCGLDKTAWDGEGRMRCADALGLPEGDGITRPFDAGRAYALYKSFLGQAESVIAGKQLLVVPSGPLTQLPFQVLVTKSPATPQPRTAAELAAVHWLGLTHPLTVLPSVPGPEAPPPHTPPT